MENCSDKFNDHVFIKNNIGIRKLHIYFILEPAPLTESNIRMLVKYNLLKHNSTPDEYNVKIINDIIYDEKKHIVSVFKDYLLLDEVSDFLKR
jgi:hypothetical protein